MGIISIDGRLNPTDADIYRKELGVQLVCITHDDCDYDVYGVHIDFLDYVSLLQDEWARVNNE